MKDKLVRIPYDQNVFEDGVKERWEGYVGELQQTTDKKLELFIQVNYFHSVLDDVMEFLLNTDQARGIPPKKIIRILFERGIVNDKEAKNAMKLNQIKNLFAHDYDNPKIQSESEKIINKIKLNLSQESISEEIITSWDIYQKLNFIVWGIVSTLENFTLNLKN